MDPGRDSGWRNRRCRAGGDGRAPRDVLGNDRRSCQPGRVHRGAGWVGRRRHLGRGASRCCGRARRAPERVPRASETVVAALVLLNSPRRSPSNHIPTCHPYEVLHAGRPWRQAGCRIPAPLQEAEFLKPVLVVEDVICLAEGEIIRHTTPSDDWQDSGSGTTTAPRGWPTGVFLRSTVS